jgi:hypothetical protein
MTLAFEKIEIKNLSGFSAVYWNKVGK